MSRSPQYVALIGRLVAAEPQGGYRSAAQIGHLTADELATVLSHERTVLADAATSEALIDSMIATLRDQDYTTIETAAFLGAALLGTLTAQARTYLFTAVADEIDRDEDNRLADAADERFARRVRS